MKRFQWGRVIGEVMRFVVFPLVWRTKAKAREQLVSKGPDEEFECEIRNSFATLFNQYGAQVVANDWYPVNGRSSILVVEVRSLRLRATLDRGYVSVDVAPYHLPSDWHLIEKILSVAFGAPYGYVSLSELGETLSKSLPEIESALTQDNYTQTMTIVDRT